MPGSFVRRLHFMLARAGCKCKPPVAKLVRDKAGHTKLLCVKCRMETRDA